MRFGGLQKLTLLDVPGHTACTVFTSGCNLRCPFCHNSSLVSPFAESPFSADDILNFLRERSRVLDGICITGGEPLEHPELEDFLREVRKLPGYFIKLDTNGTFPDSLSRLIALRLVDMVAMDIKNTPEKYAMTCGLANMQLHGVEASITLLKDAPIQAEFRTTVVRNYHTPGDLREICRWIGPSRPYFLQSFRPSQQVPDQNLAAYTPDELEKIAESLKKDFSFIHLRGSD